MRSFSSAAWIILLVVLGLLFFWNVIFRLCVAIAKRSGHYLPCPVGFVWLTDNPLRRLWMRSVLAWIGLRLGELVLELGAGAGVFTVEAAHRVGPDGKVIALDLQPGMTVRVKTRVREAGLTNVEVLTADAANLPIRDGAIDRAFLVATLSEIPDQHRALTELRRVLKTGGVLSVTEEFLDPDYPLRSKTRARVEATGFILQQSFGNFWVYTLNFGNVRRQQ